MSGRSGPGRRPAGHRWRRRQRPGTAWKSMRSSPANLPAATRQPNVQANLTLVSERGWVGWIADHRAISTGYAVCVALIITSVIGLTTISPASKKSTGGPIQILAGTTTTVGAGAPGSNTTSPGSTVTTGPGITVGGSSVPGGPGITIPGLPPTPGQTPCSPQPDHETGVTDTTINVGQIVSDVSILPAQLKPNYYGL